MKNVRWLIVGSLSFMCFAMSLTANREKEELFLNLIGIESLAYGEDLPGVEIVCGSSEKKGRCWDGDCETTWTPFGWYRAWSCNRATGNVNDFCSDGVPC